MKLTQSLSLTQQGIDEVKSRLYKLSMKKRSVLILLERPQTIQYVMEKAVFAQTELSEEIAALLKDGFLKLGDLAEAPEEKPQAAPPPSGDGLFIEEEIVLSEARFLMVNFCVDVFGTNSQELLESLRQCKNVSQFTACVKRIYEATKSLYPEQVKTLHAVIKEIKQGA